MVSPVKCVQPVKKNVNPFTMIYKHESFSNKWLYKTPGIKMIRDPKFRISNNGKTLGKLHWKSKNTLQRNGIAAISKTFV